MGHFAQLSVAPNHFFSCRSRATAAPAPTLVANALMIAVVSKPLMLIDIDRIRLACSNTERYRC